MMTDEEYDSFIKDIRECLKFPPGMVNGPVYMFMQKHLAKINLLKGNELQAIYHLTEAHGAGVRQNLILRDAKKESSVIEETEVLIFNNECESKEVEGMLERTAELPQAWTLVQLTREFDPEEFFGHRRPGESPKLKGVHVARLPCGQVKNELPITETVYWKGEKDLLEVFLEAKKSLSIKIGSSKHIGKVRTKISEDIESYMREIGEVLFEEWIILLFGRLYDKSLESQIRSRIDVVLDTSSERVSGRARYVGYLLGECCPHLKEGYVKRVLRGIFPASLVPPLVEMLHDIQETFSALPVAKRHPVILILDDRLEVVSWESMKELKRHPMSRVPCLHLVQRLYRMHREAIGPEDGLRRVRGSEGKGFYLVDPDGDLPTVQESLAPFLRKRIPDWDGVVGVRPEEDQLLKALVDAPTYIYCGHGSGCQYLTLDSIQELKLDGVQMLYGCASAALKDHGGIIEMTGEILQYTVAGSGCTLGMLWPVTSNDTDKMTITLANTWLPGTPIDSETLEEVAVEKREPQEPELLRAMRAVRNCVRLYCNGAALIGRGIPVKLV